MTATAAQLAKQVLTVTSLPTVYIKLVEAANNPDSSCQDFVTIVSEDIGLSARLMKLVNSAFFGYPSKIDSLSRAIAIVGTQQLQDLALATSIVKLFHNIPNDFVTMESFWKHSIACGVVARILANYRREFNIERAFVSGLLHDIGRLIILMVAPAAAHQALMLSRSENLLLYKAESKTLGFHHAAVGGELLKQWKLPEQIVYSVKHQHTPSVANRFKVDVALVHVADIIVTALTRYHSGELLVPPLNDEAWDELNLPTTVMETLLQDFKPQFHNAITIILSENDA